MQTFSVDQLVGRTLGEYRIERLLGHGQLGTAYLAQQLSQGRTVMLTLFNFPEGMSAQEGYQCATRFAQEGAALVRLAHPNILPLYELGEHAGSLYLVTACVKSVSLAQALKLQGRFTPHQTLAVLKQVAAGLDYAHSQGAVHGGLSLYTVLLSDKFTVQLAGFGLRALREVYGKRQHMQPQVDLFRPSESLLGKAASVSPEHVLVKPADARSDLYALGVMLFELLSGTPPFRGATPLDSVQQPVPSVHAVCPDVPEELDLVIGKTLERDPARRYQRAGECAVAFEHAIEVPTWVERYATPRSVQSVPPLETEPLTEPLPVVTSSPSSQATAWDAAGRGPMTLPGGATPPESPTALVRAQEVILSPAGGKPGPLARVDPFARWKAAKATDVSPLEFAVTAKFAARGEATDASLLESTVTAKFAAWSEATDASPRAIASK